MSLTIEKILLRLAEVVEATSPGDLISHVPFRRLRINNPEEDPIPGVGNPTRLRLFDISPQSGDDSSEIASSDVFWAFESIVNLKIYYPEVRVIPTEKNALVEARLKLGDFVRLHQQLVQDNATSEVEGSFQVLLHRPAIMGKGIMTVPLKIVFEESFDA